MTPERYHRLGQLYHAALEVEPRSRASFLGSACGSDKELRREVELLLAAHNKAGNFFAAPALEVAAGLVNKQEKPSLSGKRFAHYGGLSLIGVGGMGDVYLGEDRRLGRKVALKVLPKKFTQDQERVRRFEQEARLASALNHPNVVTIYEVGQVDGRHFIATEYIEGQTLRERLSEGKITVCEAVEVGAQMASALAAAHEAGIIHRDIKPENVMLRRDGLVKVLDFGLAKLGESQLKGPGTDLTTKADTDTSPGLVLGTLSYMSPEQARGERLDERTDIFSLGVVLYEMVAGESPFAAASGAETLVGILEREPKPLGLFAQNMPGELERIVEKALRKDRDERYQMAGQLAVDLKALKQEIDVEARLQRTGELDGGSRTVRTTAGGQAGVATLANAAVRTDDRATAKTISSGEYLTNEGKPGKLWVAVSGAAVLVLVAAIAYYFYSRSAEAMDSVPGLPFVNEQRPTRNDTVSTDAYNAYFRGRHFINSGRPGIGFFEEAIKLDPNYALAYAALARAALSLTWSGQSPNRTIKLLSEGKAAVAKALEIDNKLAEAHAALGNISLFEWDWLRAEKEFERAIELNPNYDRHDTDYDHYLRVMKRFDEAVADNRRALELDPLSLLCNGNLAISLYFARRYDEAIEQSHKTLGLDQNMTTTYRWLAMSYEQKGLYREAVEAYLKTAGFVQLIGPPESSVTVGGAVRLRYKRYMEAEAAVREAYAASGWKGFWRKWGDWTNAKEKERNPYAMAEVYARLGEKDQAFAWLERAYERRSPWLTFLNGDPTWDGLRSEPRYIDIIRRMGLEP